MSVVLARAGSFEALAGKKISTVWVLEYKTVAGSGDACLLQGIITLGRESDRYLVLACPRCLFCWKEVGLSRFEYTECISRRKSDKP